MEKPLPWGFSMNEAIYIQKSASHRRKRNPHSVV